MKIRLKKNDFDLGTTPIENMFINTYLSFANEAQIKVYLYAFSYVHSNNDGELTNEQIAKDMNLSPGQVVDAWNYWIKEGLVEEKEGYYYFRSLRNDYISSMIASDDGFNKDAIEEVDEAFKPLSVSEKLDSKNKVDLIENIEDFMSLGTDINWKLKKNEIEAVLNLLAETKVSEKYLEYAFQLAATEIDSKNVMRVLGVIRNWIIDGAVDEKSLDDLLENKAKAKEYRKKAKEASAGPKNKKVTDDRMTAEERRKFVEEKMRNRRTDWSNLSGK